MKRQVTVECYCGKYPNHKLPCCDHFAYKLYDCYVRLVYVKEHNMYGIQDVGGKKVEGIVFCPWCGTKLPEWVGIKKIDPYFTTPRHKG